MFNPLKGIFNFLKTNPEKVIGIVEDGTKAVASGIDKIWYTAEEQADYNIKRLEVGQKCAQMSLDIIKATADENSARSVTRRYIAIIIMAMLFVLIFVIVGLRVYDKDTALFALQVCIDFNIPYLGLITGVFFFGNHMINTYTGKK